MKNLEVEYKIKKDDENYKLNSKAGFMLKLSEMIEELGPITIYEIENKEYEAENEETKEKENRILWKTKYTIRNEIKEKKTKIKYDKQKIKLEYNNSKGE